MPSSRSLYEKLTHSMKSTPTSPTSPKYHDVRSSSEEEEQPFIQPSCPEKAKLSEFQDIELQPPPRNPKRYSLLLSISGLATIGFFALILTLAQKRKLHTGVTVWPAYQGGSHVIAHCGNSSQEAKDLGCIWDLMSFGWIPPPCYNEAESKMWLEKYGPWGWYHDINGTEPIAEDEITSTPMVYTQQGYHVVHCLYILKLLHLAGMSGHIVTDEAIPLAHTQHCIDMISAPKYTDFEHINTKVYMLFARCVTLD